MYYNVCPHCGAHLDPGEVCDCRDEQAAKVRRRLANTMRIQELLNNNDFKQEELEYGKYGFFSGARAGRD